MQREWQPPLDPAEAASPQLLEAALEHLLHLVTQPTVLSTASPAVLALSCILLGLHARYAASAGRLRPSALELSSLPCEPRKQSCRLA